MAEDDDGLAAVDPEPIPDNAGEDLPPGPEISSGSGDPDAVTEVSDPEAEHKRKIDLSKLHFAMWFTGSTTVVLVGLSILEYLSPGYSAAANDQLSGVSDAMKFLATTSLGYIFGRSMKSD